MLFVFVLLGAAGILAGSIALARNVRQMRSGGEARFGHLVWLTLATGIALAIGSFFVVYPYSERSRIVGFPFPAAAWEKDGNHWLDFVSPLSPVFSCANAVFAFVLPHLFLRVLRGRRLN